MKAKKDKEKLRKQKSKLKRRRVIVFLYKILLLAIVLGAMFAGITVFFQIDQIRVDGETRYNHEDIISVADIQIADNLFFIEEISMANRIYDNFPYIEDVNINRIYPSALVFKITEATPVAAIRSGFSYYLIDKDGKILEQIPSTTEIDITEIRGISVGEAEAGQNISVLEKDEADIMMTLLEKFQEENILELVNSIDVSEIFDIMFEYEDRFEVRIGDASELDRKIRFLFEIEKVLSQNDTGIIDLTSDEEARFRPFE